MIGHLFLEAAFQHTFSFSFFLPHVSPFLRENRRCVCVSVCVCVCECQYEWRQCECIYLSLSLSLSHHRSMVPRISTEVREDIIHLHLFLCLSLSLTFVRASLSLKHKHRHTHPHILSRFVCVRGIDLSICISIHIYGLHRSVKYIFTSTNE